MLPHDERDAGSDSLRVLHLLRYMCPCWIGEDPDGGICEVAVEWHFDRGTIDGVDVSGLTLSEVTGRDAFLLVFFVVGWTVMVFAMMLPTSLPLITLFHTMTRGRPDHTGLVTLLIVGYVSVWMWFGVAVHAGDFALHEGLERVPWLDENSWVIGAGTLMVAGVYQFTPLKYHCLDKCRSPLMFITQHWRGSHERMQSLRLGMHHGVFCVGCCWSLMPLMFAMGAGNIGWMLVLGMVMAIEKNMP